jgi:myosin heavy subunit
MTTFEAGTWVWMPDESDMALPAKVVDSITTGSPGKVKTEDGEVHELDAKTTEKLTVCHQEVLNSDVDNLIKLNDLNENAILHNLRIRFKEDLIYTYVSSILIAVNPFKMLPLYTPERLDEYKEKGARDLPPHVYAIADNAYRSMLSDDKSQSCICSGESGAGKTEATKSILQYLAEVSGGLSVKATDNTGSLEQQILQANPVMEAFGNAKTSRNNNSSRFGKLISIMFDAKGSIVGGSIINYLLEKSRVVGQSNEERNYHIFYQILAGQHAEENEKLKALKLGEPEDYQYTNQSGCIHIDGVSDEKEFEDVRNAMTSLRLTPEEQLGVFRVTGALLVAGNLEFEVVQRQTQEDASEIKNMDCLKKVASMLDVEHADLNRSLTSHNIGAMSKILVAYSETQAKDARDAMVKKVYSNLFNWLIEKINATLALGEGGATAKAQINVLDIFGFESFELNSFEQLCINYCNEKLQSHFNEHIFKLEQDEYKSQGVVVADTAFKDNQPCLDMLEMKNTGVFAMLDEEIRVPKGSDAGFLQKILDRYVVKEKHPNMKRCKPAHKHSRESFIVDHYAGEVVYTVTSFLEKNKDALGDDIQEVLKCSGDAFVVGLMTEKAKDAPAEKKGKARGRSARPAKKPTLGEQFKEQLASLMKTLKSTAPHFVRTMKPNSVKKGDIFTSAMMLEQLRYAGLLEVCRIRQIGYPVRRDFESFFKRFKPCVPSAKNLDELIEGLTKNGVFIKDEWAKGTNKMFMRNQQSTILEQNREDAFSEVTSTIQRSVRRMLARCKYLTWKATLTAVEAACKSRDFESLQANMHLCDDLPNYGKHLKLVREAKVLLARLQEEDRIKTLIKTAIDDRQISDLRSAVQAAEGMSPPLDDPCVAEAKSVIARLEEEEKLIANIKKAIESRNLADLSKLLDAADELDPPLDNDVTSQGHTLKKRLEEEGQVLEGLKGAIAERSLANLRVFLTKAEEMGLKNPELAEGKKMQEILIKEQQARSLLAEATENRKLEPLISAIKKAIELGLTDASPEVTSAKALQGVLETEAKCSERLSKACDERNLVEITAAMQEAQSLGMAGQAIVSAGLLAAVLKKEEAATVQLKEAIDSKDVDKLAEALTAAGELGMATAEVSTARALSLELGSKNAATGKLAAVAGSDDMAEIEAAIAEGEGLGLSASPQMEGAKNALARLKEEASILADLNAAVAAGDLAGINASMDKATEKNMGSKPKYADAVSAGKAAQKKLDASNAASKALAYATNARDVDLLTSAIVEAKAAGVDTVDAEKLVPELK